MGDDCDAAFAYEWHVLELHYGVCHCLVGCEYGVDGGELGVAFVPVGDACDEDVGLAFDGDDLLLLDCVEGVWVDLCGVACVDGDDVFFGVGVVVDGFDGEDLFAFLSEGVFDECALFPDEFFE